ncbi:hypothetical protein MAL08_06615 [Leptospira noguchii]|uniref:hypothetical protein n=1 Tax=Leptospira noguchii TaxID=28182 RepID=UPI001FB616DC|nr:hypothetical protein [Leptospira noguchii]UOG38953.1 hypothetical protein MAL08_06615 [Leptospira noguchii]
MNELKQNALLNSASHSPWVVRQVALTKAKRFLRKRFRVNKLRLRTICCITFPAYN